MHASHVNVHSDRKKLGALESGPVESGPTGSLAMALMGSYKGAFASMFYLV